MEPKWNLTVPIGTKNRVSGREWGGEEGGSKGRQRKQEMRSFLRKGAVTRPARTRFW